MFLARIHNRLLAATVSLISFFLAQGLSAQDIAIDCGQMPHSCMKKLLKKDGLMMSSDIERLEPTCAKEADLSEFRAHTKSYYIDAPLQQVWQVYKTISPEQAWQGDIGSFAFMYSRYTGELKYASDDYPGIAEGQVIFLNLRFLRGLFNLAVGQEVTEVNDAEHFIRFCYLENGRSAGSQSVKLESTAEGGTRITHQTSYKSDSEFRDKRLYPLLHSLIIKEYHQSIAMEVARAGSDS